MKATRRQAVLGALAVPAVAGAGKLRAAAGTVVVYDPALVRPPAPAARPITGDRIRFACKFSAPEETEVPTIIVTMTFKEALPR